MGGRTWERVVVVLLLCACGSTETSPDAGPAATLRLLSPASGAEVYGAASLAARLTDGDAAQVVFYLDEATPASELGTAQKDESGDYLLTWFSDAAANGSHAIIVRAIVNGTPVDAQASIDVQNRSRADLIPAAAVKQTPGLDAHPPMLEPAFASMFQDCVPLPGPVNTAGAEDAPYITADGQELYTFFTPDASVPPNLQLVDRVTGIYRSVRDGTGWTEPRRVHLNHYDDPSLDGCETVFGDQLWFCTARAGVERSIDIYVARRDGDNWVDWKSAGTRLNIDLQLGELHIADAGKSIYYHSELSGGQGGIDLWVTRFENDRWQDAENLAAVNTQYTDGWPWVSADGLELWFTHAPAAPEIWRSRNIAGTWQPPEKVVGPFAGEPTFDSDGNLYFTHHFWDDGTNSIIEADIYVCTRR